MEATTLQVAQIIADLQTLQNADASAAHTLVTAHKDTTGPKRRLARGPRQFDTLERRPAQRSLSSSWSAYSSGIVTPAVEDDTGSDPDPDMSRAHTLAELMQMRHKVKQIGDMGLTRAKQRVDAIMDKYAMMEMKGE